MNPLLISWIILILLTISVVFGLIYLSYWIPKRLGNKKLGIWLSRILMASLLIFFLATLFKDQLFFKHDAKKSLKEHGIELKDEFQLNSNSSSFDDTYLIFDLTISMKDKERLKTKILSNKNYQANAGDMFDIRLGKPSYSKTDTIFDAYFQDSLRYGIQYYKPDKQGYAPIWDMISISKTENKLTYVRIID